MKITVFICALMLLLLPQQALAVTGSDTDSSENRKERLQDTINGEREAKSEEIKEKKTVLQAKLQTIKDERKKVIAEKLDGKLETMNKNRTDRMSEKLTKLSEILSKLEAKKIEVQTNGNDVSAINAAIVTAEQTIAAAETAVAAQAAKDYTAQITSESTLKQNFGVVVAQLRADLKVTHKTVADAKTAVKAVARTLK